MKRIYFRYLAIVGNMVFILLIFVNGIYEGFIGNIMQVISYIGVVGVLVMNTVILSEIRTKKVTKKQI